MTVRSGLAALSLAALTACSRGGADPASPAGGRPAGSAATSVLDASDLPAPLPTPLSGDPMGVTIHRLRNGLTVYLSTDRSRPRFAAWIAVRAGSRMDPATSTGLAHYLEHMLFKGTRRLGTTDFAAEAPQIERVAALYRELREAPDDAARAALFKEIDAATQAQARLAIPNELDQLYASLGITGVNAFTSDEQTVYVTDVPRNRLRAWATIEADRFAAPQFRLFWPELESVYEEKNVSLDSPQNRMFEAVALALFPHHPYGTQSTIGTIEHLKTPAYDDMAAYFQRWYAPNNMAIVLAGDVDAATALPVLERAFAGLSPRPLPRPEPGQLPALAGRVQVDVVAKGEEEVLLGWQTVPARHADRDALEVMHLVLANPVSGLLNVDLVLPQKVPAASGFPVFNIEAGLYLLSATAREGQTHAELEQLLRGVVARLARGDFTKADLDAVVTNAEIAEKRRLESNEGRVEAMATAYVTHQPWPEVAGRLARLRKVTRDDVTRVARRYLADRYAVVRRVRGDFQPPKIDKPAITPVALDAARKSPLGTEVRAMEVDPIEPAWLVAGKDYVRGALPAGDYLAVKNPHNDLFTVTYRFDVGERREPLLCHALALAERSGAGDLPAEALARTLYAMGTTIEFACATDSASVVIDGVDRNLEASVATLEAWLRTPRFDDATVAALLATTLSKRKDQVGEPREIATALAQYAQRGDESRFRIAPSNAALRAARPDRLRRLLTTLPDRAHRTTYFGVRAAAEAGKVIGLGARHTRVERPPLARFRQARTSQVFLLTQPTAQSQVRIAVPGAASDTRARAMGALYSEYMSGGMGALIFQEIREARGLAYSAWGFYEAGDRAGDQSAVLAGLGTQGDKTLDALTTLLGLLEKTPITGERLEIAKRSLEEGFRTTRIEPRAIAQTVQEWDDLGEPDDPRPRHWKVIDHADAAALTAFAGAVGGHSATLISLAGDASRFDVGALARLGTVVKVEVGQLFSY